MKKLFLVSLIILAFSFNSFSQTFTGRISLEQLVEESDLIVMGTLRSVSNYTNDNIDYSQGVIVIDEFVAGNVLTTEESSLKTGDKIKLTWQNPSTKVNGRIELGGSKNNEVIWILKVKNDGTVTSNYFECYWSPSELKNIKSIVKRAKTQKNLKKVELFEENFSIINGKIQQSINSKNIPNDEIKTNKKSTGYSDLATLITLLISLSLYWIFYRSKFKIR